MNKNIPLKIAVVLLCMVVLSVYLMGGMSAKYRTAGAGADGARVAGMGQLTLTESQTQFQILPGVDIRKDPQITMTASEVAVRVYVDIRLADGWQREGNTFRFGSDFLAFTVADGWSFMGKADQTYSFSRDLEPGESLEHAEVIQGSVITVSASVTYDVYYSVDAKDLTITIQARAVQMD